MEKIASSYFVEIFATKVGESGISHILSGVDKCNTKEANTELTASYIEKEIFGALNSMGPTKAPGIDGFPAIFFQNYWHIVGKEVCCFCLEVLNNGMSMDSINSTNIVIIPKIHNPTTMCNFKPIGLCTEVLHVCIDKFQSAFSPGRLISDNVLLAYELLQTFS
ncbi:reverse transcriptase [Gossypium australe]|uniref:Reverse transcriptase n=1 Tax=Gossypium australe TaxID=47621 RepID=A0A5B6VV82_9ROSI|nr:reverse transcriptase [Gossypium australe]